MEFLKYIFIGLLVAQFLYSGPLKAVTGLVAWTIIWVPIAFVINLIVDEPWSYFGFWVALWDWESSTWADFIHANIGAGLATITTLASNSSKQTTATPASTNPSEIKPKG